MLSPEGYETSLLRNSTVILESLPSPMIVFFYDVNAKYKFLQLHATHVEQS